ncbi:MAG: PKD domain-containing protein, partial [Dehalococcoidia bacterium]
MRFIKLNAFLASLAGLIFLLPACGASPPQASFSATPASGQVPVEVHFEDKSSGSIAKRQWDFDGDGVADSSSRNPKFTYTKAGIYKVSLTVSKYGRQETDTAIRHLYFTTQPGAIDFAAEPRRVKGLKKIQFTDLS